MNSSLAQWVQGLYQRSGLAFWGRWEVGWSAPPLKWKSAGGGGGGGAQYQNAPFHGFINVGH